MATRNATYQKKAVKVIIYQPQANAWEGNTLNGRAAIAGKEKQVLSWCWALFFLMQNYQRISQPVKQVFNLSISPVKNNQQMTNFNNTSQSSLGDVQFKTAVGWRF